LLDLYLALLGRKTIFRGSLLMATPVNFGTTGRGVFWGGCAVFFLESEGPLFVFAARATVCE
jgi:hypothetical protein